MKQHYFHTLLFATLLGLNIGGCSQAPPVLIVPVTTGESVRLHMKLDKTSSSFDWQHSFAIYVEDGGTCCEGRLPIQGIYHSNADGATFEPDFPFAEGTTYHVRLKSDILLNNKDLSLKKVVEDGQEYFETQFTLPVRQPRKPAKVVRIYPSSEELPANLLRFYIYFSSSMRTGFAQDALKLVAEDGRQVEGALMHFKQELWSPDQKRLTVLFDPGRIKRGVSTNLEVGPALRAGESYRLIVDREWENAQGVKLERGYEKRFRVSPALRSVPDPWKWQMTLPSANSFEELTIEFIRPFDHALLRRMFEVRDDKKRVVVGTILVDKMETRWRFKPTNPWQHGDYVVVVDAALEDLAGNNLQGLLDRPVEEELSGATSIDLPFKIN
ncbi:hypothetical protein IH922_04055 [candidate division KSB1 bacterium]|nr:hypothetical protein [candidate division KSB1 bacterium]